MKKSFFSIGFLSLFFATDTFCQLFVETATNAGIIHHYVNNRRMGGGGAFFDYNNDGWLDIYLTGGEVRDRLYENNGDGTFSENTDPVFDMTNNIKTVGVSTGDINNDGYREIFVTAWEGANNLLFYNNGNGTFTEIAASAGITEDYRCVSATFGDYNLDGYLDIYVANHLESLGFVNDSITGQLIGFAHTGFPNLLYKNNGDNTFTEIAQQAGVADTGLSLATTFSDHDNDGDVDIISVNDFGEFVVPNQLYRNEYPLQDTFTDVSVASGMNVGIYGMGVAVGDYDQDLDLDYYFTNIGKNVLLNNLGDGTFIDTSIFSGTDDTYVYGLFATGWGAAFFDYDNDTHLDLYVANGHIPATGFIANAVNNPDRLYRNLGNDTFQKVDSSLGINIPDASRGLAYGDYDNDGDQDILVIPANGNLNGTPQNVKLLRNDIINNNNWLKANLIGTQNNRDAFGAHMEITTGGKKWLHEIDGGSTHLSQNSSIAHFGLGAATLVDTLKVIWPGGNQQTLTNISANQTITITEILPPPTCDIPTGINIQQTGNNKIVYQWDADTLATRWQIQYRIHPNEGGGGNGTSIANGNAFQKQINGLSHNHTYQSRIRKDCGPIGISGWRYYNFTLSSIKSTDVQPQLNIFPNPANEYFTIAIIGKESVTNILKITNSFGKKIEEKEIETNETITINTSEWSSGIYLITYHNGTKTTQQKLILTK